MATQIFFLCSSRNLGKTFTHFDGAAYFSKGLVQQPTSLFSQGNNQVFSGNQITNFLKSHLTESARVKLLSHGPRPFPNVRRQSAQRFEAGFLRVAWRKGSWVSFRGGKWSVIPLPTFTAVFRIWFQSTMNRYTEYCCWK